MNTEDKKNMITRAVGTQRKNWWVSAYDIKDSVIWSMFHGRDNLNTKSFFKISVSLKLPLNFNDLCIESLYLIPWSSRAKLSKSCEALSKNLILFNALN